MNTAGRGKKKVRFIRNNDWMLKSAVRLQTVETVVAVTVWLFTIYTGVWYCGCESLPNKSILTSHVVSHSAFSTRIIY